MEQLKGWKTLLFSLATVVLGFLVQFDWVGFLGDGASGWAFIIVGLVNAALRFVTDTPVLKSKPKG
jgi:hypothetical protein